MAMHRPLVFDPERSALLNVMVERACHKALKRGLAFSAKQDVRTVFAERMIGAIEAGETDPEKLESLALADEPRQAALSAGQSHDHQRH